MADLSKYPGRPASPLSRRQVLVGLVILFLGALGGIVEAVHAIHTGEKVPFGRVGGVPMTGYEAGAIALGVAVFLAIMFYYVLRSKED